MLNVNYNFYHHLNPDFPKDRIIQLIQNKDYKGFMEQYYKWSQLYLPKYAFVYADEDYEHSVNTDITNEYNFKEITFAEYECG